MAGLLDLILGAQPAGLPQGFGLGQLSDFAKLRAAPSGGFDTVDSSNPEIPPDDASGMEAGYKRIARSIKRPDRWGFDAKAIPAVGDMATMLATGGNGGADSELPPTTNDPTSAEPQVFDGGDVPLPRPRPKMPSDQPDQPAPLSMAPQAAAANAQGQQQQPASGQAPPFGGAPQGFSLSNIFKPENAPLFLALGQMAGAPSLGTGIRRASAAAVAPAQLLRKEQLQQTTQAETYRALVARGVSPQDAIAAVRDPNIMKAVAAKYFETKPRQHVMIKGPLGDETPASFDQNTGKYFDAGGNEMKSGGDGGNTLGTSSLLAQGVKYDANLTGDEYLNQFSPDVKAAAKAYINGDVLPTGNPRQKAIATYAKTVAQRYGQDTGIPVSDALFAEKRKYRTELGSTSANSAGGQAKAFNQGIQHMGALVDAIEKYKPSNALGIPSVAHSVNWLSEAFSTKQADVAKQVNSIGQTLSGEVGKLFSGSAGGGVHERELTRKRFESINSAPEFAGALEATLETMEGGLKALEQRRDQVLGPNSDVTFIEKETQKKIDEIRAAVRRLRGEGGSAAPAATVAPKPGNYVYDPAAKRLVPAQ